MDAPQQRKAMPVRPRVAPTSSSATSLQGRTPLLRLPLAAQVLVHGLLGSERNQRRENERRASVVEGQKELELNSEAMESEVIRFVDLAEKKER